MPPAKIERSAPEHEAPEVWVDEGSVRRAASDSVERATGITDRPKRRPKSLPAEVRDELGQHGGRRAPKMEERLGEALAAFDADRFGESRAILSKLVLEVPAAPAVRELYGLTLYRMERWKHAAVELEAFRALTASVDQNPVLADCYRALRRYTEAEELWAELRTASPSSELLAEGRMVAAGCAADQGRLSDAIELLERSLRPTKHVARHHLRQWFALADLYDRAGETPRARSLFERIRMVDAEFPEVDERLRTLGR
jgi:tetratricopeptide (TPR) repeat protein